MPVDSEYNAIFHLTLHKLSNKLVFSPLSQLGLAKIVLTDQEDLFRNRTIDTFDNITPEQAIAHPNWSMGKKISVDSATMMNKGLEYIEARWLFNADRLNK